MEMAWKTVITSRYVCTLLILCLCAFDAGDSRPISRRAVRQRREVQVPVFPTSVPTQTQPKAKEDCFVDVSNSYIELYYDDVAQEDRNRTVVLKTRRCCDGWEGVECDQRIATPVIDPENPCANLTCDDNPTAQCAVVKKCGRNLPVFFDEMGGFAECKNGQPVDIDSLTCSGVCKENPCEGKRCPAQPEALCFSINTGCECKALWLLPTSGAEVNCETEEENSGLSKRQAGSECS